LAMSVDGEIISESQGLGYLMGWGGPVYVDRVE
jgi:hypothetical protein